MEEYITDGTVYYPGEFSNDSSFIGFTYGSTHSSAFGIVRVTNGNRLEEGLFPTLQDKVTQIPGADGSYFFGSYYPTKIFNLSFAFESVTEKQFKDLKMWLNGKEVKDLIFDETPYKKYRAKPTGSGTIKHLCFEEDGQRIYKGEGNVQFTCYFPFGISTRKWLNEYGAEDYVDDWKDSVALRETPLPGFNNGAVDVYNPGDFPADFTLKLDFSSGGLIGAGACSLNGGNDNKLVWEQIQRIGEDDSIVFSSRTELIEGYKDGRRTGNLYNIHIKSGHFFKIPTTIGTDKFQLEGSFINPALDYDYLYL